MSTERTLLVIETATAACSVALLRGREVAASIHEEVGRGHAERLVPMIAELPDRGRADAVLVDCGPGSFTGVRVGLAAARGLGLGWGVPVRGYSSLALLAAMGFAETDIAQLVVAITGGHGELFVQRFARGLTGAAPLLSLIPEEAAALAGDGLVIGSGGSAIDAVRGGERSLAMLPRADAARLLPDALKALAPAPLYGRAPDARPSAA